MRLPSLSFSRALLGALLALTLVTPSALYAADKLDAQSMARLAANRAPQTLTVVIDKGEQLELPRAAASIFIANPDIADVQVLTPTSIMVYGKKYGQTTLVVSGDGGKLLAHKSITVTQNLADLGAALRAIIPGSQIKVEAVPGGIVLSGEVNDPAIAEDARRIAARYVPAEGGEIINRIKVKRNNQIEIRVRFAEVSRDVDKRLGINWENAVQTGSFTFGLGSSLTSVTDDLNGSITGAFKNSHFSVNSIIDALAKDGLVTVLAEPSLIALSGQTASFLAGGEFPIPVPQSRDTITIEWKQYGVSLAFTPTILADNRINLHVRPEVSQLSSSGAISLNNIEVPALTTRRAETTVELASGQSFAIAGLLNNNQSQSISKFPLLGDMPILGPLFRSSRFQNNESELVIVITPYIVKPATQEQLALPTDGFKAPSDSELFFGQRLTSDDPNAPAMSGQPRAVRQGEPTPAAAPRTSVTPAPVRAAKTAPITPAAPIAPPRPAAQAQPAPRPVSIPAAMTPMPSKSASPAGGGFIVE